MFFSGERMSNHDLRFLRTNGVEDLYRKVMISFFLVWKKICTFDMMTDFDL